jgi:hypothetical protein
MCVQLPRVRCEEQDNRKKYIVECLGTDEYKHEPYGTCGGGTERQAKRAWNNLVWAINEMSVHRFIRNVSSKLKEKNRGKSP